MMKAYAILLACFCAVAGCNPGGPSSALRPWFAPDSTVSNRADALNTHFAAGTPVSDMQTVLGTNGIWFRLHGPSGIINPDGSYTDTGHTQRWSVVYEFEDGLVHINIQDPTTRRWATFDKATWSYPTTQVPLKPLTSTTKESANTNLEPISGSQ